MRILPAIRAPLAVLAALVVLALAGGARAESFVDGFEDLPLMPGLQQSTDSTTLFDSPYGRIVEAYASGPTTPAQVLDFYAETLPQLGWTRSANAEFRREGETLHIAFPRPPGGASGLVVRFEVSPD
ncbi:hypothetical protein [Caenispirillum bisanense]|uniref:Uncharacterized protein n=1 Tax=Caenispirillum bisanense TaxID=414052 RepID=A0A286GXP4_9PROT|nr:hypothetical protein [Caenispirillum bisanense]SOE00278.1 hypothetical protein SAMN05421508_11212 [Caenispirillum bisanense]